MVTAQGVNQPQDLTVDEATDALREITSPDRKRKLHTPDSPNRELNGAYRSRSRDHPSLSPEIRHTSAHSSNSANGGGDSASSSRGGGGEETLTLRRREANRLAAQRFRSRKKGYQDSLEERIRILEDEKDVIARRLDQTHQRPTSHDDGYYRQTEAYPPHSPDRGPDGEIRYASLESANRRLQDELRGVIEDNARLRDEVDRWRKWERDQRESRPIPPHRPPALAPLDLGPMGPPSYTSAPHATAYPPHPTLERANSYTRSYHPPSPGPRLPPLRIPSSGNLHTSPNGRPTLPRPESLERVNTLNGRPQSSPKHHL